MIRGRTKGCSGRGQGPWRQSSAPMGRSLAAEHKRTAQEFAETLRPHIEAAVRDGAATHVQIATALNDQGIAPREPGRWHATSVARLLCRLELAACQSGARLESGVDQVSEPAQLAVLRALLRGGPR